MCRLILSVLLIALAVPFEWSASAPVRVAAAAEPLNVVVTLPVLKDWVQQVGGAHVRVVSS
ncbi:MAG: metal ABC transporter substrate-binding protein [Nitrospira sp.]|nr:metal ABC transporter substrate-binding protein [Nitrospira sp.]